MTFFLSNRDAINLADFLEYPARRAASAPFAAVKMCSKLNLHQRGCLIRNQFGSWQKTSKLFCPLGLPLGLPDLPFTQLGLPLLLVGCFSGMFSIFFIHLLSQGSSLNNRSNSLSKTLWSYSRGGRPFGFPDCPFCQGFRFRLE